MDILTLLIYLVIFGFLLYIVTLIPMEATVRQIVIAVAILAIVLWVLQAFGVFHLGYIGKR